MEALDAGCEGLVDGAGTPPPWLVIGGGARQPEPEAEAFDRNADADARREEVLPDLAHEFTSGRDFPWISQTAL